MIEDRALELSQSWTGLEAEFQEQSFPRVSEHLERRSLTARAVQRKHQLRP